MLVRVRMHRWDATSGQKVGQQYPTQDLNQWQRILFVLLVFQFIIDGLEVTFQQFISISSALMIPLFHSFFICAPDGFHVVAWEGAGKHVDELEDGLEAFVD